MYSCVVIDDVVNDELEGNARAREHRRIYHRDSTIDSTPCHGRGRCDMEVEEVVGGSSGGG